MSAPHGNYGQPPHRYPNPCPYPQPHAYPPPYPPAVQPHPGPGRWPAHPVAQANYPALQATGNQPVFQVRVKKHTGAVVLMFNQTYTVTGTFAQCEAALRDALLHNLLAGWWSMYSILIWNWVVLLENHNARKTLRRQAAQTYAGQHPAPWTQPTAPNPQQPAPGRPAGPPAGAV